MRTHSAAGLVLLLATGLQACGSANGADAPKAGEPGAIAGPATTTEWFVDQAPAGRSRLRPRQRHVGQVLLPGDLCPRASRSSTTTETATWTCTCPGTDARAGRSRAIGTCHDRRSPSRPSLSQRSIRGDRRPANAALHRCDGRRADFMPRGYGMGVAAGDIDNDGCVDLFLTRFGHNQLFRNNCNGTFSDLSAAQRRVRRADGPSLRRLSTTTATAGSTSTSGRTCTTAVETHIDCFSMSGRLNYCAPDAYRARPGRLFRNRRDGTFADVTGPSLAPLAFGPALGSATADFDGDGWLDIYVANDGAPNQLWRNQGNGTFRDIALLVGHGAERRWQDGSEHGPRRRRLRCRRRRGSLHRQPDRRGNDALSQRWARHVRGRRLEVRRARPEPALHRIRRRLARLRQRRVARHSDGQRRRPPGGGSGARTTERPGCISGSSSCATWATDGSATSRPRAGRAFDVVGGRPRRRVRRRRQRRRHRRARRQQRRARCACSSIRSAPATIGSG